MDKSNLIVNYLPSSLTEGDLRQMFGVHGDIVSVKIVRDKSSGISMGFGFVNFQSDVEADSALQALNGTKLAEGKTMKVSIARPAWKSNIHSNVYVSGLPTHFEEEEIRQVFSAFEGNIENLRMLRDKQGGFRGIVVIRFDTEDNSVAMMKMFNGLTLPGTATPLQVKPWKPEFRAERVDKDVMASHLGAVGSSAPSVVGAGSNTSPLNAMDTNSLAAAAAMSGFPLVNPYAATFDPMTMLQYQVAAYQMQQQQQAMALQMAAASNIGLHAAGGIGAGLPSSLNTAATDMMSIAGQPIHTPSTSGISAGNKSVALFVFHLPATVDEDMLRGLFQAFGPVESVKVVKGKGYGFVNYLTSQAAQAAVESMNGYKIGNKHLKVEFKHGAYTPLTTPRGSAAKLTFDAPTTTSALDAAGVTLGVPSVGGIEGMDSSGMDGMHTSTPSPPQVNFSL